MVLATRSHPITTFCASGYQQSVQFSSVHRLNHYSVHPGGGEGWKRGLGGVTRRTLTLVYKFPRQVNVSTAPRVVQVDRYSRSTTSKECWSERRGTGKGVSAGEAVVTWCTSVWNKLLTPPCAESMAKRTIVGNLTHVKEQTVQERSCLPPSQLAWLFSPCFLFTTLRLPIQPEGLEGWHECRAVDDHLHDV